MLFDFSSIQSFFHSIIHLPQLFIKQKPIMRKVTNYLMMFMMAATVLFVTSCGEDTENTDPVLGISHSC